MNGSLEEKVEAVRRFNRFFTRRVGALRGGLLHSPYSLAEARILFEGGPVGGVSEIRRDLGLDPGYLSRLLAGLEERGVVRKSRSEADGRRRVFSLAKEGEAAYALLDERSRGDMGWVVHRHGVLYAKEYGWDETFEALVAGIVADFITTFDPARERAWLAEMNGERVGGVFLVEPTARGLGLGGRLVEGCIRFARRSGYEKVAPWTNSALDAARRTYEKKGFVLVDEEKHRSFGRDLVGQNRELAL